MGQSVAGARLPRRDTHAHFRLLSGRSWKIWLNTAGNMVRRFIPQPSGTVSARLPPPVFRKSSPHPWVRLVFSVLKASPLPWTWDEVVHHWQTAFPVAPAGLPVTHLPSSRTQRGWSGVRDTLQRLGILYIRLDGHPDVSELYRLEFGFPCRHYPLQFEFHFGLNFLYSFT